MTTFKTSSDRASFCADLHYGTANYTSLESLKNVDFGKKYELPVFLNPQKKIAKNDRKNDCA